MKQFWFVWNPSGRDPSFKHETEESAILEAERLARANAGKEFVVLEAIAVRKVDSMMRINLRQEFPDDQPF